jgi:polar amino acid transport system substrate-binding protein
MRSCRRYRRAALSDLMKIVRLACYCGFLFWATVDCAGAAVSAPLQRFASTEWPPYSSRNMPEDGLASAVVSAVVRREGGEASFDYFPWKRTVAAGVDDPAYVGYMPTWRSAERDKSCYFSTPISNTSTVFATLRGDPLQLRSLDDLKGIRIGVVAGFANGDDFDAQVAHGTLLLDEGLSDDINIRKLLAGRIRVVVIEKHVLQHLLATGEFSAADRERVLIAEHLVRDRPVYICFKRTPDGLAHRRQFDDAARTLDLQKIERDYLKRIGESTLTSRAP